MAIAPNPINDLIALHALGRFADMERQARISLKSAPAAAILNELLGIALSAQQRHTEALPFLRKATRREPNDAQFWENLALCQRHLGQLAEAEQSLRRSSALRPSAETLNALGSVLRTLRREDEAQRPFKQALQIDPDHAGANFNLGRVLLHQDPDAAIERALERIGGFAVAGARVPFHLAAVRY